MKNNLASDRVLSLRIFSTCHSFLQTDAVFKTALNGLHNTSDERRHIKTLAGHVTKALTALPPVMRTAKAIGQRSKKTESAAYKAFLSAQSEKNRTAAEKMGISVENLPATVNETTSSILSGVRKEKSAVAQQAKSTVGAAPVKDSSPSQGFICDVVKIVLVIAILTQNEFAFRWASAQAIHSNC